MSIINNNRNSSKRSVNYLGRDFPGFYSNLKIFSETYFPDVFNDFSPASPVNIFMEMASYVGDVLSFYLDNQVQENYLQYARQSDSIYALAYMSGYKPKVTGVANVDIDLYQIVPSKQDSTGTYVPDYDYALIINQYSGLTVEFSYVSQNETTDGNISTLPKFILSEDVDFSINNEYSPTEVSLFSTVGGNPEYFLLKKKAKAFSGTIKETQFDVGAPEDFLSFYINDSRIIGVVDIFDSDNNQYHEVDYLGHETIFKKIKNTNVNDPNNYNNVGDTPYLLKVEKVQRRFTSRFVNPGSLMIQFGSGKSNDVDEEIVPNQNNVGIGLPFTQNKLTTGYSPQNFIFTDTYGIAPNNTTLTVRYMQGGGIFTNILSNVITGVENSDSVRFQKAGLNSTLAETTRASLVVTNPSPATGGNSGDTLTTIRENSISAYGSQMRAVTLDDYIVRVMSMPSEYGVVSKAYIEKPKLRDEQVSTIETLSLYVLGYDSSKKLSTVSDSLKTYIRTYLNEYRMIGDSIEIRDAFIINIGVEFDIIVRPQYNNNLVLTSCITVLRDMFNIDNWQINEPILLRDIYVELDKVEGVQTVKDVRIINKNGIANGYTRYGYDIDNATIDKVVYPALDPSIFEVKYPNEDIKGRVVNF